MIDWPGVEARTKMLSRPPLCSFNRFIGRTVKVTQPVIEVRFVFTGVTTLTGMLRIQTAALRTTIPRLSKTR